MKKALAARWFSDRAGHSAWSRRRWSYRDRMSLLRISTMLPTVHFGLLEDAGLELAAGWGGMCIFLSMQREGLPTPRGS